MAQYGPSRPVPIVVYPAKLITPPSPSPHSFLVYGNQSSFFEVVTKPSIPRLMNSRSVPLLCRPARGAQEQTGQKTRRCEFGSHNHILGETVWKWQVFRQFSTEGEDFSIQSILRSTGDAWNLTARTSSTKIKQSGVAPAITKLSMPFAGNPTKWKQVRRPWLRFAYAPQKLLEIQFH